MPSKNIKNGHRTKKGWESLLYCYKLLCREHTILSSEEAEQINAGTHPPRTDNPNYGQLRVKGNLGELNYTSFFFLFIKFVNLNLLIIATSNIDNSAESDPNSCFS